MTILPIGRTAGVLIVLNNGKNGKNEFNKGTGKSQFFQFC